MHILVDEVAGRLDTIYASITNSNHIGINNIESCVPDIIECLNKLPKSFTALLAKTVHIIFFRGMLIRSLEVGQEKVTPVFSLVDWFYWQMGQP
jgi:hypothetical protein